MSYSTLMAGASGLLTPRSSVPRPNADLLGDDTLLTPQEAAEALRKTTRTLERWRSDGKGPRVVFIGRTPAYRLGDLRRFIREGALRPLPEDQEA